MPIADTIRAYRMVGWLVFWKKKKEKSERTKGIASSNQRSSQKPRPYKELLILHKKLWKKIQPRVFYVYRQSRQQMFPIAGHGRQDWSALPKVRVPCQKIDGGASIYCRIKKKTQQLLWDRGFYWDFIEYMSHPAPAMRGDLHTQIVCFALFPLRISPKTKNRVIILSGLFACTGMRKTLYTCISAGQYVTTVSYGKWGPMRGAQITIIRLELSLLRGSYVLIIITVGMNERPWSHGASCGHERDVLSSVCCLTLYQVFNNESLCTRAYAACVVVLFIRIKKKQQQL